MRTTVKTDSTVFDTFLRGPSKLHFSSSKLNWNGFAIEHHTGAAREVPEKVSKAHLFAQWHGNPSVCVQPNGRTLRFFRKYPGSISLFPAGLLPAAYSGAAFNVVLCALDQAFVTGIREELDSQVTNEPHSLPEFRDLAAAQILELLTAEARQGGPMGSLYVEHLAHALALRLINQDVPQKPASSISALPQHQLQRVLDRMQELDSDLDLQTLANETGYSRSHFLRMFRTATGCTPHCYLLKLRVERAKTLLKNKQESLIDISATCGFSSHAHMTKIFRQFLGVTPSEYRRNL